MCQLYDDTAIGADRMIDVIVPTHHGTPYVKSKLRLTMQCIESLYMNTKTPFHLIIVDDSKDILTATYLELLQTERKDITVIHSVTPYKSGNQIFNEAFKVCKTPYAAIVVNSVMVEKGWDEYPLDLLSDKKIGAVGLKCVFPTGLIETCGIFVEGLIPKDIGRDLPGYSMNTTFSCEAVSWSFVVVRREAVGVLDENTYHGFAGWDDIDNCFTMRKNGWKVVSCPLGVGVHYPRSTRCGDDPETKQKLSRENGETFYRKWGYWKQVQEARKEAIASLN